ncbi:MAG: RNA methyltransferase [Isosphaeraceae bacterium]
MTAVSIDDLDDPRIAIYRHLKAHNLTRHSGQFVVEGEKLFERLVASRFPVASVLVTDRLMSRVASLVPSGAPLYVLSEEAISALVGYRFHQGVLACGQRCPWPEVETIVGEAGERSTLIVCPRLDNPENLGTIARLADVFGVDALLVGGRCPDPFSRRVLRVSMGSVLRVPVIRTDNLRREVDRLRCDLGFTTAATVVDPGAEPLDAFQRPNRLALFLGCEGNGLEPEWVESCAQRITIPMRPNAESLNVAVAAGIVLHHVTRSPLTNRLTS